MCARRSLWQGRRKKTEALAGQIGRNIGIAFQVYDDILDYTADQYELQKPILEDLAQGVYTLPLIFAKKKNIQKHS